MSTAGAAPVDYRMLINGNFVSSSAGATFDTANPYTGLVWATAPAATDDDVDRAVRAARAALSGPWGQATGTERARLIRRLASLIERDADKLAHIETTDNGKLIREMTGQMRGLPEWYYYFAGAADKIHGETIPSDKRNFFIYTLREPIGVVATILPWNSPLLLLAWKLCPALAAGCSVVVKPAEQTPISALEFGKLFDEAGFPPGVFNVVTGDGAVGKALASHPEVDKIAFTGSTQTGIQITKDSAEHLAKTTLELGGKSPNIVFPDAAIDAAVNGVVSGIFAATGQSCTSGSRLLVHRDIHDSFIEALIERATRIKLGDPADMATEMGPVAFPDQLSKIESYLDLGLQEGVRVACGGKRPSDPSLSGGLFLEPTILIGATNNMRVAREEIFGPVLCVIPFADEDDAVCQANDSVYGLAAGVWTSDVQRAHRMAARLRAGTVWINAYRTVRFNAPFGGVKMSGRGRENGLDAIYEYTTTKSVYIETDGNTIDPFIIN